MNDHIITVWGLWVAVVAAVAAIVAAVAAIWTLIFAKDAPTKDDLARVEENTAHLEEVKAKLARMDSRHEQQEYRELVNLLAERVRMSISGQNTHAEPFVLHLRTTDPHIVPVTIELHDEVNSLFGSFGLNPGTLNDWEAEVASATMFRWFEARVRIEAFNRAKLSVRVIMLMNDLPASRQLPVTLSRVQIRQPGTPETNESGWMIEGEV